MAVTQIRFQRTAGIQTHREPTPTNHCLRRHHKPMRASIHNFFMFPSSNLIAYGSKANGKPEKQGNLTLLFQNVNIIDDCFSYKGLETLKGTT